MPTTIGNVIGAAEETGSFNYAALYASNWGEAPSGGAYNSLSAYYGYGYNSYISGVAGTSPFFANFLASTGYSGGSVSFGGYDITGSFVTEYYGSGPLAFPSEPWALDPNYALPNSSFSIPDTTDVYFDLMSRGVFSPAAARGIVGSIVNESGGNPWISEIPDGPGTWTGGGGRPGYGVFQFTDYPMGNTITGNLSMYWQFIGSTGMRDDIPAQVDFMLGLAPPGLIDYLASPGISQFDAMRAFSLGFEAGRSNFLGPLPGGTMGTNIARDMTVGFGWAPDPNRINPYSIGPMDDSFIP